MSRYLERYIGTYRVLLPVDKNTNDFPRNPTTGKIETDDYYIPCKKSGKYLAEITHYKDDVLTALVFSPISPEKHNLIKLCQEKGVEIVEIVSGTGEFLLRFHAKDMDVVADFLGATTQGKNIRPFSIKNLPKSDYTIPPQDLADYDDVISVVPKDDKLLIAKLTSKFLEERVEKSIGRSIEKELRLHKMSRQQKEFIHMKGLWTEYLEYLKGGINESCIDRT